MRAPDREQTLPAAPNTGPPFVTIPQTASTHAQAATGPEGHSPALPAVPGYVVRRELARGGMGVVYAAHDPAFDREAAVKVMHPGQDAGRFVTESKVTAQLPHPGIPPVYALGALADGRPFLAMKLITGRTLADELRGAKRADLPRLLDAFERVCQTVGFAHARGIVHRDLKPANVMVGQFGEVLVMDWGLAKRLTDRVDADSGIPTAGRGCEGDNQETVAGAVIGTPAYMAPEQARGEAVDCRADVFALGGILAAILTDNPPFVGNTVMDTVLKAARAELDECFADLDECGADAELVAVAKRCLASRVADRCADGEAVAAAVSAYRVGVDERLRAAERERAAAEVRATEQRKRRAVQLALALCVLALVSVGGGFAWHSDRQAERAKRKQAEDEAARARDEAEREVASAVVAERERVAQEQTRRGVTANLALATELRKQYKFKAATAAVERAVAAARVAAPNLVPAAERARADLALVEELDDIRFRKWVFVSDPGGRGEFDTAVAPPAYRAALAARGLDPTALDPAAVAALVAASDVNAELVASLDDWALYEPDPRARDRLLEAARKAAPGAWTDRLRTPALWATKDAIADLAAAADAANPSAAALTVLAVLMERNGLDPAPMLSAARTRHPTDFELAFAHGQWHTKNTRDGQQIGPYDAARALRPDNRAVWNNLANALTARGDTTAAIAASRRAVELAPDDAPSRVGLGNALAGKGDWDGAVAEYRRAAELAPAFALAHANLGVGLASQGDSGGAIAAYRRAIELNPDYAPAHTNLGNALNARGGPEDRDAAVAAHLRAIQIEPTFAVAYYNLGVTRKTRGETAAAIAAYQRAAELNPNYAPVYYNMGGLYLAQNDFDRAAACARAALKANPRYANAFALLGVALQRSGDVPGARAALTEATRIDPRWSGVLAGLPSLPVAPPPRPVGR